MAMTQIQANKISDGFAGFLRQWRHRQKVSQLELSMQAGLSQRHISFLETGRSNPSRVAIYQLGEALQMPAAEVDAMLVAAGFSPKMSNSQWSEQTRLAVAASIAHVLEGHEPYPAMSIDRLWNLQSANTSALQFFGLLGSTGDANLLREIFSPGQVRKSIINWPDICRALYRLFELEVTRQPNDKEALKLLGELRQINGVSEALATPCSDNPSPVLSLEIAMGDTTLKLFSMIATIGMSADPAIDDIRIETLLPTDECTRNWFAELKKR